MLHVLLCAGIVEVYDTWNNKVAPCYEGAPSFAGEVERQLQDAMGEQDTQNITIVTAQEVRIKTGFSPPMNS